MHRLVLFLGGLLAGSMLVAGPVLAADLIITLSQTSYDAGNRPVCSVVRMDSASYASALPDACVQGASGTDRITRSSYDDIGRVRKVEQGVGSSSRRDYATYTYTANGQLATSTDANGNTTAMGYDGFDRLSAMYFPSKTSGVNTASTTDYEQYAYDNNGNRTYLKKRGGQVLRTCFDSLNRTTVSFDHDEVNCAAKGGSGDVYTSYDAASRVRKKAYASYAGDGVSYVYDNAGRLTSATDKRGRAVSYQYNAASALSRLTWPGSTYYVDYGLDNLNRVTTATANGTATLFSQAYNMMGLRKKLLRGSVIAASEYSDAACIAAVTATCYSYDGLGRLTRMTTKLANTNADMDWSFANRNPVGQIGQITSGNGIYEYKVPQVGADNHTFNGLNQDGAIAAVNGGNGFDANGNLINDGGRVMVYDVYNRLISVAANTSSTPYLKLEYDPEGRLYKYTYNNAIRTYVYDGTRLIAEYDGDNQIVERFVHGTGTDEPLVWYTGTNAGVQRLLYADYQGSIMAYSDASGNFAELYRYSPYGERQNQSGVTTWTGAPFGYTGQLNLPDAQLYYYKARVYDPAMGRFLQTDPVGSKDDLDLYSYVGGDPVNATDPTGMVGYELTQRGRDWNRGIVQGILKQAVDTVAGVAKLNNTFTSPIDARSKNAIIDSQAAWLNSKIGSPSGEANAAGQTAGYWGAFAGSFFVGAGEANGGSKLALGLSEGLDKFSISMGAKTWKNFADPLNWKQGVLEHLADPSSKTYFNLSGVDVWGGLSRASAGKGGATDWELLTIYQNPQWWDRIQFWQSGKRVVNPFK